MNRSRYASLWQLTEREEIILVLMADGLSNHEIADQLGISERTARTHCGNILSKMCVPSRTAAAALVWRERVKALAIENARLRGDGEESAESPDVCASESIELHSQIDLSDPITMAEIFRQAYLIVLRDMELNDVKTTLEGRRDE